MVRVFILTMILVAVALTPVRSASLPQLQVQGNHLVANGHSMHLRGIDWGWWHLQKTTYTQTDMSNLSHWNANVARLAFSYTDLETNKIWDETKARQMDQVVKWGARDHVYIILDMHMTPGGQNQDAYDDGGGNHLWDADGVNRKNFLGLWKRIAQRYKNQPAVAAYELLNEPDTGKMSPDPLPALCSQAISDIRAIDPNKIIVLAGNKHDGATSLTDEIYQPNQTNILYTMHFYDGSGEAWLHNLTDGPGISGTQDWTLREQLFTAPPTASHLTIMLRSVSNKGTAWFDDVRLEDSKGHVLEQDNFSNGSTDNYAPERGPLTSMTYDASVGHAAAGSLSVHGTADYNGWSGRQVAIIPGKTYLLSAWVRLSQATGDTYLSAAFFSDTVQPRSALQALLPQTIGFSQKYNVPVWIGEFGCPSTAVNNGQSQWVSDCISLFEEAGFDWTYWNFKETTDPSSMALQAEHSDGSNCPINRTLLTALKAGWSRNR